MRGRDDIDRIIERVLAASRSKGGHARLSDRAYGDEPILVRGSQLASWRPEPIVRMRRLATSPEARSWSDARLFVEQGRLMADYEDDVPGAADFSRYFPTYQDMSDRQLRAYFSWRARVRAGEVRETCASFAYVYLYELINGIGVDPGPAGFEAIRAFWEAYREHEPGMDRHVRTWLVDYAVVHGLEPRLALPYVDVAHDRAVGEVAAAERRALGSPLPRRGTLRDYAADPAGDERLLAALDELSTYRIARGALCRERPEDVARVTRGVFDRLAHHYAGSRAGGLAASLFGTRSTMPYLMFSSAVYWCGERHEDCVYELGPRVYECRSGLWTCTALHDGGGRSDRLGQVLHAVDQHLRDALGHPRPLRGRGEPKYLTRIVEREVADYLAWREAHAPRRVEIDLGKLDAIRSDAARTRESLLVDEEREDPLETPDPPRPAAAPAAGRGPGAESLEAPGPAAPRLGDRERALLEDLLAGRPPEAADADLLVDAINESLFDLLGDTAVEFGPDGRPALVEDYADELRAILSPPPQGGAAGRGEVSRGKV